MEKNNNNNNNNNDDDDGATFSHCDVSPCKNMDFLRLPTAEYFAPPTKGPPGLHRAALEGAPDGPPMGFDVNSMLTSFTVKFLPRRCQIS
ncbi:hypothetical protein F2P81_023188 [Scophthalmus maximus]|uniref:Uncharacterized protein n=1 Tax=Scophthalmus maximus TaxID=52904 RepID=A0A6A4RP99_SCOMX|nr:hypothetical protein F2P81_023188 [Scophthalmus maximus]